MKVILNYISEVRVELSKVVWPKRDEIIRLTGVVIFISFFVGAYLGALDFVFTKALELFVAK